MNKLVSVLLVMCSTHVLADELPLEHTRSIEFSTQQVSWLSLDVSPDGKTLVFEALGDLYTVPSSGGQATAITTGMAFDSQPRFSPDGQQVVFVSDRSGSENLWIVQADGSKPRQVTEEKNSAEFASPAFSPDGGHVIASRTTWGLRTFELWAYHLDGGKGTQLTKSKATSKTPTSQRHNALGAVYSPDARYLYYARKNGGFSYNLRLPAWQIARRDLRDGSEVILTFAHGSAIRPVLTPDGQSMVYATRHEQQTGLRLRNLETGEDEWLAYPVEHDEQESRFTRDLFPGYAFDPTGQALYFPADGRIQRLDLETREQQTLPITVPIKQDLGPALQFPYRLGLGPVKARLLQAPELSPDGEKLAFSAFAGVYVHNLVSGETEQVTPAQEQAFHPTWSPNGRHIAYVTWTENGGHIKRVRASGGRSKQLTEQRGYYTDPAYNSDGTRIVALRASSYERLYREHDFGQPVGTDVVWLPAAGGTVQTVIPANGLSQPHFGPEADRIYLYLSGGIFPNNANAQLVSLRYDGSDRRSLLSSKGPGLYSAEGEVSAEDMRLSPDGAYVLIRHANQLYVTQRINPHLPNQSTKLSAPAMPQVKLTEVGADHFGWNGDQIYWTAGHTLYTRALGEVAFREPEDDVDEDTAKDGAEEDAEETEEATEPTEAEQHPSVSTHTIELYKPRYAPEGVLALTNATILTMAQGAEPIENGVVVIAEGRILAVGEADNVEVPPDATVMDLNGQFLAPGYIDTHAHFRPLREVMDKQNPAFLANLAYGVTTGLDVQPSTVDIIAYEDMIDAGLITGPRTLSTGPGIFSNNAFKSKEQALKVLTRYKDHYGVHNLKAYISGNRKQRQYVAMAAQELKLMPTTEGGLDMKLDLTHAIDGFSGNEHNLPLHDLYDDVVQLMVQSEMSYTPTLLVTYGGPWAETYFYTRENPHHDAKLRRFTPYPVLASRTLRNTWAHEDEYPFKQIAAQAKKIIDAGGRVGVGAHGQLQGLGFHWELWALASGGLTNQQALTAATRHGAEIIGVGEDLGTIEPGKLADLVVLSSDPLADIRNSAKLGKVIKNGEVFDATTLDKEWPSKEPLPEQWWWNLEPTSAGPK